MFKIIIFFYIIRTIYSSEEINEKYIDLLPEAEKQEFLNRIARRILEGIQSDDVPNESHVDITDDQLDQHQAYVQDIIKQESENLRNKESKESSRTNDNNYADFSSHGGKREKRKDLENIESSPEPVYNVIPVKTIYEDYDTISKPNNYNASINNSNNHENAEINFPNNNQDNERLHSAIDVDDEISNSNSTNLSDVNVKLSNIKTTDTIDFEFHTNDNTTSDNADYEITTSATLTNSNSTFKDKIKRKSHKVNETVDRASSNEDKIILTTDKITNFDSQEAKISNIVELKDDNSTARTTDITITNNTTRNGKTINYRRGSVLDQTLNFASDEVLQTSTSISTSVSNIPKDVMESNEESVNENNNTQNILKIDYKIQNNSNENSGFKPNIRDRIVSSEDESKRPKVNVVISPKKEYEVYEVAPGNTPFIMSKNLTERTSDEPSQQNYVPVYNFAPENAYFKPHVRYGPETSEKDNVGRTQMLNKKELNLVPSNRLFGKVNKYSLPSHPKYPNEQLHPYYNFLKPKTVKPKNIYYNPYDYLDVEYDTGQFKRLNMKNLRNREGFPNSDEEDHPINSIHKSDSVKDHIRAVRNLMYLQNIFGPLAEVQRKSDQSNKRVNINNKNDIKPVKFRYPVQKSIAIDYYFERMDSDEDLMESMDVSQKYRTEIILENEKKSKANGKRKDDVNKKNFKKFFNSMTTVLKDIIRFDNDALKQYEWLQTTVELQVAIRTLLDILHNIENGEHVDSNHMELFKYSLYLYKISKTEVEDLYKEEREEDKRRILIKQRSVLPHNKNRHRISRPLQLWKDFVHYLRNEDGIKVFNKLSIFYEFENFLEKSLNNLYNFHKAIKNIATITTYKTQNWYIDLKQIFLNKASKRDIGEVILHLSLVHLLNDVEDSRSIIEEDYKKFIKNYNHEVQKAKDDFVFVLLVLDKLDKM